MEQLLGDFSAGTLVLLEKARTQAGGQQVQLPHILAALTEVLGKTDGVPMLDGSTLSYLQQRLQVREQEYGWRAQRGATF